MVSMLVGEWVMGVFQFSMYHNISRYLIRNTNCELRFPTFISNAYETAY